MVSTIARRRRRIFGWRKPIPRATSVSYTPLQIAKAYSFPSGNGAGQTIGIIELGGGYAQSDLQTYFTGLKLAVPKVIAVSVDGAQNAPTGDPNGPDTEVALDIEVAGAVAPGATIVVYFAPNTDAGFLDAINQAATDNVNKPSVISISWGGPESTWTAALIAKLQQRPTGRGAVGVTVCVACGDNGSSDGVSDGKYHVDFPASSPYSLACGGTSLKISGSIDQQRGGMERRRQRRRDRWRRERHLPASFVSVEGQGAALGEQGQFQRARRSRHLPAMPIPKPVTRCEADGSSFAVGGTSAVAPLWAGLVALFNQGLGKPVDI